MINNFNSLQLPYSHCWGDIFPFNVFHNEIRLLRAQVFLAYLDQPIPLGVKKLEDLLEVFHLIFSEALVFCGHSYNAECFTDVRPSVSRPTALRDST